MFLYTFPAVIQFISTALCAALLALLWPRRSVPGVVSFGLMMVAVGWWSFSAGMEAGVTTLEEKILWSKISYFGIVGIPALLLQFALRFTGQEQRLTRWKIALLWGIPIVVLLFTWTNEYHGLIWRDFIPVPEHNAYLYVHGPMYWALVAYSYVVLALATLRLAQGLWRMQTYYRLHIFIILFAISLPWISNVVYILGLSPFPGVDPAPISFALTGILLAVSILLFDFLNLVPVAREKIFETLGDGLIVLDNQMKIVDINAAAVRLLGLDVSNPVGRSAADLLPDLMPHLRTDDVNLELELPSPAAACIELRTHTLRDGRGSPVGRVVVIDDHSERWKMEVLLKAKAEELERLSVTDELTRLYNRRHAQKVLEQEITRANRHGLPLSVAVCDIDLFKRVNDRYGHGCGDDVIRMVSNVLRTGTRHEVDVVARVGGEEFMVIFPNTELPKAWLAMERLRERISQERTACLPEMVTISGGVTEYIAEETVEDLLRRVDRLLYAAKNKGRNRILKEAPEVTEPVYEDL